METEIPQIQPEQKVHFTNKHILLFILIALVSTITIFTSGFYTHKLLLPQPLPDVIPTIQPSTTPIPGDNGVPIIPGKQFYEDTIMLISETAPHITLVASASRFEQTNGFLQNTRVSYFDGTSWTRKLNSQKLQNHTIGTNDLVQKWDTIIDPSKVLQEESQGKISINNIQIDFKTETLENEIGIRSLPGYTKFMSEGGGTFSVNGQEHQAKVLYTRIYSSDSSEMFFYSENVGLQTDWIALWDTQGNFYHVDSTNVKTPVPNYKTHSIGILEDLRGSVSKTFDVTVRRDTQNSPKEYTVILSNPINTTLTFSKINSLSKAPDNSYEWSIGQIEGSVQKSNTVAVPAYGLAEYIFK